MADEQSHDQTVAIKDSRGRVTGSGFMLTRNLVLTCAHVVADALGTAPSGDRPRGEVQVRLPALLTDLRAEVMAGGWLPLGDDRQGDLAVLSLLVPAAQSVPASRVNRPRAGAAVHLYGYDRHVGLRRWNGVVRHTPAVGSTGWTRLEFTHREPLPGMSGVPVIDSDTGAVVGMLLAAGQDDDARAVGWMLSVQDALDHVPVRRPRDDRHGLTARDAGVLAESLTEAMALAGPGAVDLLVRLIPPAIAGAMPRSPVPRLQLMALVMTCARHANGLRALTAALETLVPGSVELESFTTLVDKLTAQPLLLPAERLSLQELLAQAADPVRVRPGLGDLDALVERAVELEDAPVTEGELPPLLTFVSGVAELAAPRAHFQLFLWVRDVAQRLGIDMPPGGARPRRRSGPAVLKFTLTEAGWEPGRYEAVARLLPDPDRDPVPLGGSDGPIPLTGVQELVQHTLRDATRRLGGDRDRLRVEFELPRRLLELDVESWSADEAAEGRSIGMLHPVTVRVGRRGGDVEPGWRERWKTLVTQQDRSPSTWLEGSGRRVLCVDVRGEMEPSAPRPLDAALAAGVPVAIWSRTGDAEIEARIEELVARTDLAALPEAVLALRRENVEAWADSIVLLYDDPRSAAPEPPLLDPFPAS
ncbi:effector-associated domain 2-containing protein [Streptomyces ossamyceticus]|uniref:Trypsin-like peptidase domain-containing protein n=1 Tax=Streptomyces ossamyceticus TaxID=249581 RepID=A0ABV2UR58_9ACTN